MSVAESAPEKIEFSSADFAENLGNSSNFGIEDTQVIASNDLNNFLTGDPTEIKKAEAAPDEKSEEPENKPEGQAAPEKKPELSDVEKGRQALSNVLFDEEDGEENEEGTTGDTSPATTKEDNIDYNSLGKDLLRLGVFTPNETDVDDDPATNTPEEFLERLSGEKKKGAINILDNFLSRFGEEHRNMFDSVFVNGVDPKEYLASFSEAKDLGDLDISNEGNQAKILTAYYKTLNWDDKRIETRLTKLKEYGDMEDEAKSFQDVMVNKKKEELALIDKKKNEENLEKKVKEDITNRSYNTILLEKLKTQEFDGLPLTEKDAQEVYSFLTEKPYKLKSGELLTAYDKDILELNLPENYEKKIKLGLLLKRNLDLSAVKKTNLSKKSEALFTMSTKNSKGKSEERPTKSFFG